MEAIHRRVEGVGREELTRECLTSRWDWLRDRSMEGVICEDIILPPRFAFYTTVQKTLLPIINVLYFVFHPVSVLLSSMEFKLLLQ